MVTPMTPDEEYDFYARPENQEPQGPARRRDGTRPSSPEPVQRPPEQPERSRRRPEPADRPLSILIRLIEHAARLVEQMLHASRH
jgi:hypothetical protein